MGGLVFGAVIQGPIEPDEDLWTMFSETIW